jgi:carbon-monoxide dehydrogenase small subunit
MVSLLRCGCLLTGHCCDFYERSSVLPVQKKVVGSVNVEPVNACLILAPKVEGEKVETVEGLGSRESLHPLQKSFIDHGAIQCGFCTPGILMSSKALLEKNSQPTREEIKEAISGHLCRCTGYHQIIEAIEALKE